MTDTPRRHPTDLLDDLLTTRIAAGPPLCDVCGDVVSPVAFYASLPWGLILHPECATNLRVGLPPALLSRLNEPHELACSSCGRQADGSTTAAEFGDDQQTIYLWLCFDCRRAHGIPLDPSEVEILAAELRRDLDNHGDAAS